ncbi:MAG: DUF4145 domain-containing protein [Gammaproteobacteria bacterium]|nr:DUF4145 domain-containing protein [Gammaproteobacteria bacterium]
MASNFDFLGLNWANLAADAQESEGTAFARPRTSAFYARRTLELAVEWIYEHDRSLRAPYQSNLGALLHAPDFQKMVTPGLFRQMRLIQKVGNQAVHSNAKLRPHDGVQLVKALHRVLGWLVRQYSRDAVSIPPFDESLLPSGDDTGKDANAAQLKALEEQLHSKDAAHAKAVSKLANRDEELTKLQAEIADIKAANEARMAEYLESSKPDYTKSETETRTLIIDVLLREAGWEPEAPSVREYEVTGMPIPPSTTGTGYVDYVLWGDDKLPLAIVEAKKTSVSPKVGQQQAKLYADCLEVMTGRRPVIYLTNGYETMLWDDLFYPHRTVQGFANKDEMNLMVNRRTARKSMKHSPIKHEIIDRYYQEEAIRRLTERYETDHQRAALLVMATGSGKTRTAAAAVELLMRQGWVRRVLFLADRTALVSQAKRAFAAHLPHASAANLVNEKEGDKTRLVFSTYHTMMRLIDERRDGETRRFGTNYFDLVIIDEAHRSVYRKFGAIFEYFDALLLGLTATPKADIDRNTYRLFNLEDNVPTYAYELDQAVADQYLVPPKAVSVPLKFQREGIKYAELTDEEKEAWESEAGFFDDDTGAMREEVDPEELNRWLFNRNTVEKVLALVMDHGIKVAGGDRLGKTIVFAKNQAHAEFITGVFDANYPKYASSFCQTISHSIKYADTLIESFEGKDKPPHIAVSVDMLDTGIDVPEVVNLIFFKRIRSKVKFWQMLGRGTRLSVDLFGPGQHKTEFFVFDFCANLDYFEVNPEGAGTSVPEPVSQQLFKRRLELAIRLQDRDDEATKQLHGDVLDALHSAVAGMNVDNFLVRPRRQEVERWSDRRRWDTLSIGDQAEIVAHVSGLPTDYQESSADEEFARRFDLLMLNLQLAMVEADPGFERYQRQVRELAEGLVSKTSIPMVARHRELIEQVETEEWWADVTLPMLEAARKKLRDLIRFIDRQARQGNVYTDFVDEIREPAGDYKLVAADPNFANYRAKVERLLRENPDHPAVRDLRDNQPVTADTLVELETLIFGDGNGESRRAFFDIYGTGQPLGQLVRQIVGLDRNAAKAAFAEFLAKKALSPDQIRFIDVIVEHLVVNGLMDPAELFDHPFTDFHHESVLGVMPDFAEEVVAIIEEVTRNASGSSESL